jgi:methylmalonyl-CoA epimerase
MTQPFGQLDHIGVAVRSISEARKFYEGILGARFLFEAPNPQAGYMLSVFDLAGLTLELLEPLGENSFLHKFLEKRGEGLHHLTFDVPDSKAKARALKEQGVRVVDEVEWSPQSYEAFISPRSSHGVLIQFGSGPPTLDNPAARPR